MTALVRYCPDKLLIAALRILARRARPWTAAMMLEAAVRIEELIKAPQC